MIVRTQNDRLYLAYFVQTIRSLLELHPAGLSTSNSCGGSATRAFAFRPTIYCILWDPIESGESPWPSPVGAIVAFGLRCPRRCCGHPPESDTATGKARPSGRPSDHLRGRRIKGNRHGLPNSPMIGAPIQSRFRWRALLRYYAATRGRTRGEGGRTRRPACRLCSSSAPRGTLVGSGELHVSLDAADTFREALMRRPEAVCSVGYPVAFFLQSDVRPLCLRCYFGHYRITGLN